MPRTSCDDILLLLEGKSSRPEEEEEEEEVVVATATMRTAVGRNNSEEGEGLNNRQEEDLSDRIFREAREVLEREPELCPLLRRTVLADGVETFEQAVASTVTHRLMVNNAAAPTGAGNSASGGVFCPVAMRETIDEAFRSDHLEAGHTMSEAVRLDAVAVTERDPACETILEVVLFFKGFAALVCHRAARWKWFLNECGNNNNNSNNNNSSSGRPRRNFTALFLQSQASAIFGVDIHPASTIGAGVMFDHGTGVVVGETATIGDGCTLLHGVTLGGTGKIKGGDRHPKVGPNVLIGAGASILGNVPIGDGAKIGAGSIVLGPIPAHATAVGAPAKIVGRAIEPNPGSFMDDTLKNVAYFHPPKKFSSSTLNTMTATETGSSDNDNDSDDNDLEPLFGTSFRRGESEELSSCCNTFREYKRMAKTAPMDSITIVSILKVLCPEGFKADTIGQIFFEIDKDDNVGYVPATDATLRRVQRVIEQYSPPDMDPERIEKIVAKLKPKGCG